MTLNYSQLLTTFAPTIPALIALGGVVVGALLGARLTFRNQFRLSTLQTRQQAYAALMGKKALLTQLFVSRFEALAFSDYHERLWCLAGAPQGSIDLEEAKRWMRKSEDYAIDLAKAKQSLFESLGTIRASYPAASNREELTERIFHFGSPVISPADPAADRAALDRWKQQVIPNLQQFVQREYAEPIDALLEWMKQHLNDPVRF